MPTIALADAPTGTPTDSYDAAKARLEEERQKLVVRLAEIEAERTAIKAKLGRTRTRKPKTAK